MSTTTATRAAKPIKASLSLYDRREIIRGVSFELKNNPSEWLPKPPPERYLNSQEAADFYGISKSKFERDFAMVVPRIKIGGQWRYTKEWLNDALLSGKHRDVGLG